MDEHRLIMILQMILSELQGLRDAQFVMQHALTGHVDEEAFRLAQEKLRNLKAGLIG